MRISDWSSDVCSSDLKTVLQLFDRLALSFDGLLCCPQFGPLQLHDLSYLPQHFLQENGVCREAIKVEPHAPDYSASGISRLHKTAVFRAFIAHARVDRKSTRLNSSH